MRNDTILKSGLAGYAYRWLRNAGLVATVTGVWLTGANVYHASQDGRAEARVMRLEIACVLAGNGLLARVVSQEVECGDAEALRAANAKLPVSVRDVAYARLAFQSDTGADYEARVSLDALRQPDVQRGETVAITYSRANPAEVRAVADAASYLRGIWFLGGGLILLVLVALARRAANCESNVDDEVAELEAAYRATSLATVRRGRSSVRPRK